MNERKKENFKNKERRENKVLLAKFEIGKREEREYTIIE